MPYEWDHESKKKGPEKIPFGTHHVKIIKVIYGKKAGPFMSQDGDPQIMPIFQDNQAREVGLFITLSNSASWVLARLLGCCHPPVNLARMEADGIEPRGFAEPDFGNNTLVNRELSILVEAGRNPQYPNVTPIKENISAESPPTADAPPSEPPPAETTKDSAWAKVAKVRGDTDEEKENRNAAWTTAIQGVGKPETEFVSADWEHVVELCLTDIPF